MAFQPDSMHWAGIRSVLRLRWARTVVTALAVVLAVGGVAQIVLPPTAERLSQRALAQTLREAELINVQVHGVPALKMLLGRFDAAHFDVRGASVGGLELEALLIDARNVRIAMPDLLKGRGVPVKGAEALRVSAVVSQEALTRLLQSQVDGSQAFRVELISPRGGRLVGAVKVLGATIDVVVDGAFAVEAGTKVMFRPKRVSVARTVLPSFLQNMLLEQWGLLIDFASLPVPVRVKELRVSDGRLFVYGEK